MAMLPASALAPAETQWRRPSGLAGGKALGSVALWEGRSADLREAGRPDIDDL